MTSSAKLHINFSTSRIFYIKNFNFFRKTVIKSFLISKPDDVTDLGVDYTHAKFQTFLSFYSTIHVGVKAIL